MSTAGALLEIASPSWLATHPPTAIFRLGLLSFKAFQRPTWWNTLSCAFSLIEQVFSTNKSASASFSVV